MRRKNSIPSILNSLKKVNYKKTIKIRFRSLKNKGYSLYLDSWHNGKREYQFLKLYVIGTQDTKKNDRETIQLAITIRDKREIELIQNRTGIRLNNWKSKANFVEYFKIIADKRKNESAWPNTYNYLHKFTDGKIQFRDIDEIFCERFKNFLLEQENLHRNTPCAYFNKFKNALNRAVREKIISENPTQNISIGWVETKREFLSIEELKILKQTPCHNEDLKNAFLFSCYTGLRLGDIESLNINDVLNGYLYIKQKKTAGIERIKLTETALDIIERQKIEKSSERVFSLPSRTHIKRLIKNWVSESGLKKNITFHSGRHTFATMCLTYDVDLFTVSKLLGHKDIKTTQIYAKLIDKKKDEAIDKLPQI